MRIMRADEALLRTHLQCFARSFIVPERAERYVTLASSKRGLEKWRGELDHFQHRLHLDRADPIAPAARNVAGVRPLLTGISEGEEVAVFSTNIRSPAGFGMLGEILEEVIATDIGAIVSVIPGTLAIYWGEERDAKFILKAATSRERRALDKRRDTAGGHHDRGRVADHSVFSRSCRSEGTRTVLESHLSFTQPSVE